MQLSDQYFLVIGRSAFILDNLLKKEEFQSRVTPGASDPAQCHGEILCGFLGKSPNRFMQNPGYLSGVRQTLSALAIEDYYRFLCSGFAFSTKNI
jgi:hypothetical protein